MLAPDLNRGMTAGTDCVDVNAQLDGTGKGHGTNHGLMRDDGRDRGTSQFHLETQEEKAHWNSMETPRENDKLTLEQSAQGIDERIHKDSKLTEPNLNPHKNKRHHCILTHKTDGNDDERVLPTKGEGSEVGKERETRFSLTSGRTRW